MWTLVPNLKKFPQGVFEISRSQEWDTVRSHAVKYHLMGDANNKRLVMMCVAEVNVSISELLRGLQSVVNR